MKVKLANKEIRNNFVPELLKERGVENIENFLNPPDSALQSYSDLANIDKGIELIATTIKSELSYGLIVDSDTDGFTSSAIIYQYLKRINPNKNIVYYIHEGKQHGLEDMWEKLQEEDFELLIIPDAGSDDAQYAGHLKYPILVLDHHIIQTKPSSNMVVINNQNSPKYKNKNLSGAGIVYQFCRALDDFFKVNFADNFIDLAAIGVIGDMMSGLEVENQWLWKKGLSSIKNHFLKTLIHKQHYSMGDKINPTTVAFYIAPLINAINRVGTQEEKERMFTAFVDGKRQILSNKRGAEGTLEEVAIESARECSNARSRQNKLLDIAEGQIEIKIHKYDLLENKILFIELEEDDTFPSELNGVLAMRMAAKFHRPAIVARLNEEGYIRGSIRGLNNGPISNFKNFLEESGYCEYVKGHPNAAGISIKESNVEKLHQYANQKLSGIKLDEDCYEVNFIRFAAEKDICDIISDIVKYENIYGEDNKEPLLYIYDINLTKQDIQIIGKNNDTVKFTKFGITYIKFHAKELIEELQKYNEMRVEIVGRANINEWLGIFTYQILIDGYEIKNGALSF